MKIINRLFESHKINSAIIFYGIVLFYTLYIGIEIDIKVVFTILFFTIIFWLTNSLQPLKKNK